jgi:hypothetical protein
VSLRGPCGSPARMGKNARTRSFIGPPTGGIVRLMRRCYLSGMPAPPRSRSRATPRAPEPSTLEVPPAQPEASAYLDTALDADPYSEILRIREELGDRGAEARVVLMRKLPSGPMAHVGELAAEDFNIGRVIKDWGGGHYEAVFYSGKSKIGSAVVFDVDPSIPTRIPEAVTGPREPPATDRMLPGADPRLSALEQTMGRMADLMNQLVVQIATQPRTQDVFGAREATELALRMAELMRPQQAPEMGSDAMIKLLQAGVDLGRSAEHPEDDGMMGVVKHFAKPLGDILTSTLERERRAPPLSGVPVAANGQVIRPAVSAALSAPEVPMTGPAWLVHLRPHLPTILGWARAGKDPGLYAEVIVDNLGAGARLELESRAKEDGFVDQVLASLTPEFQPYSAWCTEILTNVKDILTIEMPDGDPAAD